MGRAPCCDKANVKKGPWSPEEDSKLKDYIEKYGTGGNWIALPQKAGLKRCGKSCRLRWLNYLRPNIKHGEFSDDEDRIICSLYASIGSRWSIIAAQLPGRTDNDVKNYWNTKLKKKLMGFVPSSSQRKPPQLPHYPSLQIASTSSSSSYRGSSVTYYTPTSSLLGLEPLSMSSDLLSNNGTATNTAFFQAQESLMGPMQHYQVKDRFLMFGGEPSCSSSDGSCSNQLSYGKEIEFDQYGVSGGGVANNGEHMIFESYLSNGFGENQKFMIGGGGDGWTDRPNVFCGGTPLEYGVEETKQLFSNNGFNYFIDENKTQQGKFMYY